jgi:putative DNA primase/helicase
VSAPVAVVETTNEEQTAHQMPEDLVDYGEEQRAIIRAQLEQEVDYLFAIRPHLAVRGKHPLAPVYPWVITRVYSKEQRDELIAEVTEANALGFLCWYGLNPCRTTWEVGTDDPQAVRRGASLAPGKTVKDEQVTQYVVLAADVDSKGKGVGQEATDSELANAERVMQKVLAVTRDAGFADPQVVMSGNGYQLLWDVEPLPATRQNEQGEWELIPENCDLIHDFLLVLDALCTEEGLADIDTAVGNPSRVFKIPGTYSRKGLPTEERPQRLARTVSRPEKREQVRLETLRAFVTANAGVLEEARAKEAARDAEERKQDRIKVDGGIFTKDQSLDKVRRVLDDSGWGYHVERDGSTIRFRIDGDGSGQRDGWCPIAEDIRIPHTTTGNKCHVDVEADGNIGVGCFGKHCKSALKARWRDEKVSGWAWLQDLVKPGHLEEAAKWKARREERAHEDALKPTWDAISAEVKKTMQPTLDAIQKRREEKQSQHEQVSNPFAEGWCQDEHFNPELIVVTNPLDSWDFTERYTDVSFDDTSNALRLAAYFGRNIKHTAEKGFMLWDGNKWIKDNKNRVMNYAQELSVVCLRELDKQFKVDGKVPEDDKDAYNALRGQIINRLRNHGGINACIKVTATLPEISCNATDFDAQPWLFNVPGWTLHLSDTRERAHIPTQKDLLTQQASVKYDPKATCPTWEKFLLDIMCQDEEMVRYLQRWCGYALSGSIREKKFVVMLGETDTGKTTFMNVLLDILGDYGRVASMSTFMTKPNGAPTNDIARLAGARLVSASEAKGSQELSEDSVKVITGGGRVVSRLMYEELFEYIPQYKLFFDTNEMPHINSTDQALWNRMCVIEFNKRVYKGKDMDEGLPGKLRAEMSGILNWCIRGFDEWYANGLCTPEKVLEATRVQQQEADPLHEFIQDYCVLDPNAEVESELLHDAYLAWCDDNNIKPQYRKSRNHFTRDIRARDGIKKGTNGSKRTHKGIDLNIVGKARFQRPIIANVVEPKQEKPKLATRVEELPKDREPSYMEKLKQK